MRAFPAPRRGESRRDDGELAVPGDRSGGAAVQRQDLGVAAADDQERRRGHPPERLAGEVGAAAAGDDRADAATPVRRRPQCRRRSGRGAEAGDREPRQARPATRPLDRVEQPAGEQIDVEDVAAVAGLVRRQQIEEQGREPAALEVAGDRVVARAVAARSAAVDEDHEPGRIGRKPERAAELGAVAGRDQDLPGAVGRRVAGAIVRLRGGLVAGPGPPCSRAASRRAMTSSSLICAKSSYQAPTLLK